MRGGKLGLVQDCRRLCIIAGDDCVLLPTMFVQYNPVIDNPCKVIPPVVKVSICAGSFAVAGRTTHWS
jgi:hypothetical protein